MTRRRVGSCYPTLPQREAEGWGTRLLGWVKIARSRSPFDSDRSRDLRSGQALGSAEKRFARDDTSVGVRRAGSAYNGAMIFESFGERA